MNPKIRAVHLQRGAVVYVRQSSMGQVFEHTESQRRQYALAETASSMGFANVTTIDDDLGRSGSGLVDHPGFQRLVANVCSGSIGAVFCIEASRLALNGRDWHHLLELCGLVGARVFDAYCSPCHAAEADVPFNAKGRSADELYALIARLPQIDDAMPSFDGTEEQRHALAEHLTTLRGGRVQGGVR